MSAFAKLEGALLMINEEFSYCAITNSTLFLNPLWSGGHHLGQLPLLLQS